MSLPHPLAERHPRRHRLKRSTGRGGVGRVAMLAHRRKVAAGDLEPAMSAHGPGDLAVKRAQEAGGPLDRACYTCACGFVFAAPGSTTVACPHCGASQAW